MVPLFPSFLARTPKLPMVPPNAAPVVVMDPPLSVIRPARALLSPLPSIKAPNPALPAVVILAELVIFPPRNANKPQDSSHVVEMVPHLMPTTGKVPEIGRASIRESVCQYV